MSITNGNIPSLKNSKSIGQSEIQNIKQNMNSVTGQNMILGAKLTSNTSIASSQGNMGNMTNSVPSLNSSTSVEAQELQNVKNEVQKNANYNSMF